MNERQFFAALAALPLKRDLWQPCGPMDAGRFYSGACGRALPLKGTLGIKIANEYFFIYARLTQNGTGFFVVSRGQMLRKYGLTAR